MHRGVRAKNVFDSLGHRGEQGPGDIGVHAVPAPGAMSHDVRVGRAPSRCRARSRPPQAVYSDFSGPGVSARQVQGSTHESGQAGSGEGCPGRGQKGGRLRARPVSRLGSHIRRHRALLTIRNAVDWYNHRMSLENCFCGGHMDRQAVGSRENVTASKHVTMGVRCI